MSRIFKTLFVPALLLVFSIGAAGAVYTEDDQEGSTVEVVDVRTGVREQALSESLPSKPAQQATIKPEQTDPPSPWLEYDNVCETFTVYEGTKPNKNGNYPVRYRRNRYKRKRSDQRRTKGLIKMVAREMGANPEFVETIAHHESSWNAEAIHILNPDLEANRKAWERFSYSETKEHAIQTEMANLSKQNPEYYKLKRSLYRVQLYKNNPFWDTKLYYERVMPAHTAGEADIPEQRLEEWASVWSYGYGLYGMNAILYTHLWDQHAPPWILCGDEGIVATVTAIWALRDQQEECAYLSEKNPEKYGENGGSYRNLIRRFARGQCNTRRLGPAWRRLMKGSNLDWDAEADLGTKWPRFKMKRRGGKLRYRKDENGDRIPADRVAIIEHMRKKAEAKGLLREESLQRKDPESAPQLAWMPGDEKPPSNAVKVSQR